MKQPSHTHTPLVTTVTNDNSRLIEKNTLKIEAQLSILKSYVDCGPSALTSKIDVFPNSINIFLSDLQNKERSQIEVLKKNITFLQNEIKSKDIFLISEAKLDDSYPTAQFSIEGFGTAHRRPLRSRSTQHLSEKLGIQCRCLEVQENEDALLT